MTGTSGAGKGTLERALLSQMPELELAVSATTRDRREGEENGREYWFISDPDAPGRVREELAEELAARGLAGPGDAHGLAHREEPAVLPK